jgi:hypothetical protein
MPGVYRKLITQGPKGFEGDLPEPVVGWTLAGRGRWFPFYFMALCNPKEEVCPKSFYPNPLRDL